jgi:hypothetical protein
VGSRPFNSARAASPSLTSSRQRRLGRSMIGRSRAPSSAPPPPLLPLSLTLASASSSDSPFPANRKSSSPTLAPSSVASRGTILTRASRASRNRFNLSSAARTWRFCVTSESNAMNTSRPSSAINSQSASAVFPPCSLVPRKPQTPSRSIQHSPVLAAASAFLTPSVIHSGTFGSASAGWQRGGQSMSAR